MCPPPRTYLVVGEADPLLVVERAAQSEEEIALARTVGVLVALDLLVGLELADERQAGARHHILARGGVDLGPGQGGRHCGARVQGPRERGCLNLCGAQQRWCKGCAASAVCKLDAQLPKRSGRQRGWSRAAPRAVFNTCPGLLVPPILRPCAAWCRAVYKDRDARTG